MSSIKSKNRAFKHEREKMDQASKQFSNLTLGVVMDTSDPQQLGRLKVYCANYGDVDSTTIENLPWALYVSPFGGATKIGERGAPGSESSKNTTDGYVSYGMWAIPQIGSQVLVGCIDGDSNFRFWIGNTFTTYNKTTTIPHGRFTHNTDRTEKLSPVGPLSTSGSPIEPLFSAYKEEFRADSTNKPINHEWKTRGADYSATSVDAEQVPGTTINDTADDNQTLDDTGLSMTQGYSKSRQYPNSGQLDSNVYSLTSPGFHSLSMDDREENCKVKIRTMGGHKIIMDDTNERVYISTAGGKNWIEMDSAGNIDMFTEGNFSVRAKNDINFTSDKNINFYANQKINLNAKSDVRIYTKTDLSIRADSNIKSHSGALTKIQSGSSTHLLSGNTTNIQSAGPTNVLAGGDIIMTAPSIHENGPGAAPASPAQETYAFATSRVPEHEPWGRISTAQSIVEMDGAENTLTGLTNADGMDSPILELSYSDKKVGKLDRLRSFIRGKFWRR